MVFAEPEPEADPSLGLRASWGGAGLGHGGAWAGNAGLGHGAGLNRGAWGNAGLGHAGAGLGHGNAGKGWAGRAW